MESNSGRPFEPHLNGFRGFFDQFTGERAIFLRFEASLSPSDCAQVPRIVVVRWTSGLCPDGAKNALAASGVNTREISSPPKRPGIRVATRTYTCAVLALHGCNVARSDLAGQRHSPPARDHSFALWSLKTVD